MQCSVSYAQGALWGPGLLGDELLRGGFDGCGSRMPIIGVILRLWGQETTLVHVCVPGTALTGHHKLGGLRQPQFSLTGGRTPKVKVLAGPGSLPGSAEGPSCLPQLLLVPALGGPPMTCVSIFTRRSPSLCLLSRGRHSLDSGSALNPGWSHLEALNLRTCRKALFVNVTSPRTGA